MPEFLYRVSGFPLEIDEEEVFNHIESDIRVRVLDRRQRIQRGPDGARSVLLRFQDDVGNVRFTKRPLVVANAQYYLDAVRVIPDFADRVARNTGVVEIGNVRTHKIYNLATRLLGEMGFSVIAQRQDGQTLFVMLEDDSRAERACMYLDGKVMDGVALCVRCATTASGLVYAPAHL